MANARPILVPLDGSDKDARALAVALALADLSGAPIHLIHVLDGSDATVRDATAQWLAHRVSSVHASPRVAITWSVPTGDDVAGTIARYAEERDALTVVMGTRAPNVVGRAIAGSVADGLMRECPRPLVLVPPRTAYLAGKRIRFGRVLVPFDGSALAERALDFLVQLGLASAVELVLLTVVRQADTSDDRRSAEGRLEEVAVRARAHGVTAIETQVGVGDDAAEIIAGAVREYLVEMIAMSTRGRGGLRRLVLGSVAEGVVRVSEVPVLLLTPATLAISESALHAGPS